MMQQNEKKYEEKGKKNKTARTSQRGRKGREQFPVDVMFGGKEVSLGLVNLSTFQPFKSVLLSFFKMVTLQTYTYM